MKAKILKLLFEGKNDKEIISELSQGVNLSPEDKKIVYQNPPKIAKPFSYCNRGQGLRRWKEKGKYGIERDRQQSREFQS